MSRAVALEEEVVADLFVDGCCWANGKECCVQGRDAEGTGSARCRQVHDLEVV